MLVLLDRGPEVEGNSRAIDATSCEGVMMRGRYDFNG